MTLFASLGGTLASGIFDFGAGNIMDTLTQWVAGGAVWFLDRLGSVMADTSSVNLTQSVFAGHYKTIASLAVLVAAPMVFVAALQSIIRQDSSVVVRCILVNLPLALIGTGVAVEGVQFASKLVDSMCSAVTSGTGENLRHLFSGMEKWLVAGTIVTRSPIPAFVTFLLAMVVAFGALVLWVEMVLRTAAVYIAVLFLPMVLIGTAMPATIPWCKRMFETIAALVLSKLVIVATLSLAVAMIRGNGGMTVNDVVEGSAMLVMATFAPFAILKLIPAVEAGAVHHMEGLSRRGMSAVSAPARMAYSGVTGAGNAVGAVMGIRAGLSAIGAGIVDAGGSGDEPASGRGGGGGRGGGVPGGGASGGGGAAEGGGAGMSGRGLAGTEEMLSTLSGAPPGAPSGGVSNGASGAPSGSAPVRGASRAPSGGVSNRGVSR